MERQSSKEIEDYNGKGYTNDVLVSDSKTPTYYLPARVRLTFKMFTEININQMYASMDGTIVVSVYYGDLDKDLVKYIRKNMTLNFNIDKPYKLSEGYGGDVQVEEKDQEIQFIYRGSFKMRMSSNVFWSPFEIMYLVLTVNPIKVNVYKNNIQEFQSFQPKCFIKFNCMDYHDMNVKVAFTELGKWGNFDLAEKRIKTEYTNELGSQNLKKQLKRARLVGKIRGLFETLQSWIGYNLVNIIDDKVQKPNQNKHFEFAHFTLPVYKFPLPTITTIFMPLFLLSLINIFIFYQDINDLSGRIASIGTVVIAFVSLISTIRSQIPPTDQITFVELLVYSMAFTSFLSLIHSWLGSFMQEKAFEWYDETLFGLSVLLAVSGAVVVAILFVINVFRRASFNKKPQKGAKSQRNQWFNRKCDEMFIKNPSISKLSDSKKSLVDNQSKKWK